MSDWIDITRPVDDSLLLWPNRPAPVREWEKRIDSGHHCNVSAWRINAHTGTHMDAPLHFFDGAASVDQIAPDVFIGECVLIDSPGGGEAMSEEAARKLLGVRRLLIRTEHSTATRRDGYPPHAPLMTDGAAKLLVDNGLVLIGTDRLSVDDSAGAGYALHRRFLGAGCVIIEGLSLSAARPGKYSLVAAPMRLSGGEASPCRALLSAQAQGGVEK